MYNDEYYYCAFSALEKRDKFKKFFMSSLPKIMKKKMLHLIFRIRQNSKIFISSFFRHSFQRLRSVAVECDCFIYLARRKTYRSLQAYTSDGVASTRANFLKKKKKKILRLLENNWSMLFRL